MKNCSILHGLVFVMHTSNENLQHTHSGQNDQNYSLRPSFFYSLFYRFFSQQVKNGGQNKNKIHLDPFSVVLKLKEIQICVSFDFN